MKEELLSAKDARLVDAYVATGSLPKSANLVGMDRTTAWRRANRRVFQAEYRRRLDEQRRGIDAALLARQEAAWAALDRALDSGDDRVRLRAATWLLERVLLKATQAVESAAPVVDIEFEELQRHLTAQLRVTGGDHDTGGVR